MQGPPTEREDWDSDDPIFADINITPLTDVFLVLLIIFMVVSSSIVEEERESSTGKKKLDESALQVKTPQGTGTSVVMAQDVVITVLADGTVTMEGASFPFGELKGHLLARTKEEPPPRVVVRGDEQAVYKLVWEVMSVARAAGYPDVALAARPKP
jgi:biopolymer transport protein ExbD